MAKDPLAGVDKDIKAKVRVALDQGCVVKQRGSSHLKIDNPATGEWTIIGGNASSNHGPANVQAELEAISVKFYRNPKRAQRRERSVVQDLAPQQNEVSLMPHPQEPQPERTIGPSDEEAPNERPVDRIVKDPFSGDYLVEAIRDEAAKSGRRKRRRNGRPGVEWQGDLYALANKYWDDLPSDPLSEDAATLYREVVHKLIQDERLEPAKMLGDGHVIWFVYDETPEPPLPADGPAAASAEEPSAPDPVPLTQATSTPTTPVPQRDGNAVQYEPCDYCSYVGAPNAVRTHLRRVPLVRGKHPEERVIECKSCPSVLTTVTAYRQHMRDDHGKSGEYMCSVCLHFFPTKGEQMTHGRDEHPDQSSKPGPKPKVATEPAAPRPPVPTSNGRATSATNTLSTADQAGLFMDILAEHRQWAKEIPKLREERTALAAEVKELRRRLDRIQRAAQVD